MNIEEIYHSHVDGGDGLLAVIMKWEPIPEGIKFITPPQNTLQMGVMSRPKGYKIPPHFHPPRKRIVSLSQEVLVIRIGMVKVTFYGTLGDKVTDRTLTAGDAVILLRGGHGLEFLAETEILEIRQGPYDPLTDKVMLKPE